MGHREGGTERTIRLMCHFSGLQPEQFMDGQNGVKGRGEAVITHHQISAAEL